MELVEGLLAVPFFLGLLTGLAVADPRERTREVIGLIIGLHVAVGLACGFYLLVRAEKRGPTRAERAALPYVLASVGLYIGGLIVGLIAGAS